MGVSNPNIKRIERSLYILVFLTSIFCVLSAVSKYFEGIILHYLNGKAILSKGEVLRFLRRFSKSLLSLNKHVCTTHHGVNPERGILDPENCSSSTFMLTSTNSSLRFPLILAPFPACQQFSGIYFLLKECKSVAFTCGLSGIFSEVVST